VVLKKKGYGRNKVKQDGFVDPYTYASSPFSPLTLCLGFSRLFVSRDKGNSRSI
jgi:hypothetical protein